MRWATGTRTTGTRTGERSLPARNTSGMNEPLTNFEGREKSFGGGGAKPACCWARPRLAGGAERGGAGRGGRED